MSERRLHRRTVLRHATAATAILATQTASWSCGGLGAALLEERAGYPYFSAPGWQLGCWTRPWAGHDYRVGFDAMAKVGFRYVALTGAKTKSGRVIAPATTMEEAIEVGAEARKRELQITHVYGGDIAIEKGTEALKKMIDRCEAAKGWSVLISRIGDEKTYENCLPALAECCDYAASKKIAIVLKPHGGTTGIGRQLRDAVEKVHRNNFTVMYDPGNIYYYSKGQVDPIVDCDEVAKHVTSVSIKDFRPPDDIMFTPGVGKVDFPLLLKKLRQAGMQRGPLMIESLTPGDLDTLLVEAKKGKELLEKWVL